MALPDEVPELNVPCEIRSKPLLVGDPFCPATMKLGLLSQNPALRQSCRPPR
jgi:hypothetical protein